MNEILAKEIVEYIGCLSIVDEIDGDKWNVIKEIIYNIINNKTNDFLETLRKKLIEDLKEICLREEHDPNEFMYCGCQDEIINIINKRFGVKE